MKGVVVDSDPKANAWIWHLACSCHHKSRSASTLVSAGSDKEKETVSSPPESILASEKMADTLRKQLLRQQLKPTRPLSPPDCPRPCCPPLTLSCTLPPRGPHACPPPCAACCAWLLGGGLGGPVLVVFPRRAGL